MVQRRTVVVIDPSRIQRNIAGESGLVMTVEARPVINNVLRRTESIVRRKRSPALAVVRSLRRKYQRIRRNQLLARAAIEDRRKQRHLQGA